MKKQQQKVLNDSMNRGRNEPSFNGIPSPKIVLNKQKVGKECFCNFSVVICCNFMNHNVNREVSKKQINCILLNLKMADKE